MSLANTNLLLRLILNQQKLLQPFRNRIQINPIKNICRLEPITAKIRCRPMQITRLKILRQHIYGKTVIHIFYYAIDGTRQFTDIIKFLQRPKVTFVLITF